MKLCPNWSRGRKIALVAALLYLAVPLFVGTAFGKIHWIWVPFWPGYTPCPIPVPIIVNA